MSLWFRLQNDFSFQSCRLTYNNNLRGSLRFCIFKFSDSPVIFYSSYFKYHFFYFLSSSNVYMKIDVRKAFRFPKRDSCERACVAGPSCRVSGRRWRRSASSRPSSSTSSSRSSSSWSRPRGRRLRRPPLPAPVRSDTVRRDTVGCRVLRGTP